MNINYKNKTGQSLEEAAHYILDLVEKFIDVNTFCITKISQESSHFISVFNRSETIASEGVKISVYDAY